MWPEENTHPQLNLHHISFNKNLSNQLPRFKLESPFTECSCRGVVIQWAQPPTLHAVDGLLKSWAQIPGGWSGCPPSFKLLKKHEVATKFKDYYIFKVIIYTNEQCKKTNKWRKKKNSATMRQHTRSVCNYFPNEQRTEKEKICGFRPSAERTNVLKLAGQYVHDWDNPQSWNVPTVPAHRSELESSFKVLLRSYCKAYAWDQRVFYHQ